MTVKNVSSCVTGMYRTIEHNNMLRRERPKEERGLVKITFVRCYDFARDMLLDYTKDRLVDVTYSTHSSNALYAADTVYGRFLARFEVIVGSSLYQGMMLQSIFPRRSNKVYVNEFSYGAFGVLKVGAVMGISVRESV